jgi:hypothetical protein
MPAPVGRTPRFGSAHDDIQRGNGLGTARNTYGDASLRLRHPSVAIVDLQLDHDLRRALDSNITPPLGVGLKVAVGGVASEVKKTSLSDIV